MRIVAERSTQLGQVLIDRGIAHNGALPHLADQLIRAHHLTRVASQIPQHFHDSRLENDGCTAAAQLVELSPNAAALARALAAASLE